jgi:hypothetical protein
MMQDTPTKLLQEVQQQGVCYTACQRSTYSVTNSWSSRRKTGEQPALLAGMLPEQLCAGHA